MPGVAYPWRTIGWRLASKRSSKSPIDSCFLLKPRSVTVKRCPSQRGILPSSPALAHGKQNQEAPEAKVRPLNLPSCYIHRTECQPWKSGVFLRNTLWLISVSVLEKIVRQFFTVTHHTETHWNTWSSRKHQTYYINCIVCWISEYLNKCMSYHLII